MPSGSGERKLAAILAADVVGYSRLMGADEDGTLAGLNSHRHEVLEPLIDDHRGRIVKTTGDGLISEFQSVVEAVRCAVAIQRKMAERNRQVTSDRRFDFRIGIHVGDVVDQDGDIFGDGVNIAARLEGLAEPGGICVSARVQEDAAGKVEVVFDDLGEQTLKNIARPIRAFRLRPQEPGESAIAERPALSLPDKPSIAVLPFQNMSGDQEQEYFADGMVEDITTALSRFRWLFVIARNSSFTYKGRAVDVKKVGRELGVRYVLEGSVRKAGNRVRITGQLIDASTGAHLWADRFDGDLADVFELQDQVTSSVVGTIAPKLEQAEIERSKRKPTESLDAYDYYLRGMAAFHQFSRKTHQEALKHFYRAVELDPNFAAAYGMAARCYLQRIGYGWVEDRQKEVAEAERLSRRAGELGKDDAVALSSAGLALAVVARQLDDGTALIDLAVALNPNLAWAWLSSGMAKAFLGEPELAIQHAARAMRISPHDPQTFALQMITGFGHFFAGRDEEALSWAATALRQQPNFLIAACVGAAAAGMAGNAVEAERIMTRVRELNPGLRLSGLKDFLPIRKPEHIARWAEGLKRAGLPE